MNSKERMSDSAYDELKSAFGFFQEYAKSGKEFKIEELASQAGWKVSTPKTYWSKNWKSYVEKVRPNRYRVRKKFLKVDLKEFLKNSTQSKEVRKELSEG